MVTHPTRTRRLGRLGLNTTCLALGAGIAYVETLDMPHHRLHAARANIAPVIQDLRVLEPGLDIDDATLSFRFDPGLDPVHYGPGASQACGFSGTVSSFGQIVAIGFIEHGYDSCAESALARQARDTGLRQSAADIYRHLQNIEAEEHGK